MSELAEKLLVEAERFATPIPGPEPQGADISYEPSFEVVRVEIDKLTTMAGELPNWREVVEQGEELLSSKSKDMRLAIWAATARLKTGGVADFARGLAVVKRVCESHWDGMYPPLKRAKARGNLASWMGEQALTELAGFEPKASDRAAMEAVNHLYNELDELFSTKLGDAYSGLGPIRSLLRDKLRMIPAEPPPVAASAPAAPQAPVAPARPVEAPSPAGAPAVSAPAPIAAPEIPSVSSASDALPALRTLGKGIADVARTLRSADPSQPWPYRLARLGVWLAVKQPPPAEGGKTKIPPPQAADTKKLQSLLEAQQWGALVSAGEELAGRFLFWLDTHRFVAVALERQGPLYHDAAKVVVSEVLAFVATHPVVLDLTFADGTPFADEATRGWLEEERGKLGGGAASGGAAQRVDEEEVELRARFEEAKELVLGGKVGEGLGLAMALARRGGDARARFRARLELASMGIKGGKPEVARPILEGLVREAEEHGLEHWEPELAARTYEALLKARTGSARVSEPSDGEIFDRLCRLDPAAASRLNVP